MKLGFVTFSEAIQDPELMECLCNRFKQVPLETEYVVKEPQFIVPLYARKYKTYLYLLDGMCVTCEYLSLHTPSFKGTSSFPSVYMFEVWEDLGVDGHIEQHLVGYNVVAE